MSSSLRQHFLYTLGVLVVGLTLTSLTACDSNDGGSIDPAELNGDYRFTQFSFNPEASRLDPINVLEDLRGNTRLEIFGDEFLLPYRLRNNSSAVIQGSVATERSEIRLNVNEDSQDDSEGLLLPNGFRLSVSENRNVLTRDVSVTLDGSVLENYDPDGYQGLGEVRGTLQLRLERANSE